MRVLALGLVGGLLVAGVFAAGALGARSAWNARSLVRFPKFRVPAEDEAKALSEVNGLEKVTLRTSDGLALRGWAWAGPRRAMVVFVHGGAGNRLQLFSEARALARHGYGFLVYDSRASGDSEGDLETWGDREQRDVFAALDYASSRPDVDPARIAVFGFSIGASTVALAAAKDVRARAVVLGATWTSLEDEIKRNDGEYGVLSWGPALFVLRRAGVDVDAVRPIDVVGRISPRPLLMIAGAEDGDTPVAVMERLFRAAGEPKELWVEPGAGHGGYYAAAPAQFEERVVSFLERAFER